MSGPNYGLSKGYVVDSAAVNVKFGRFCKLTANQVVTTSGAGEASHGVFQETLDAAKVSTGKATIGVAVQGIHRVEAGAAVSRLAAVVADSVGRGVTVSAVVGSKAQSGIALTPASAAGDMIDVLLTPYATVNTAVS